ncbi:1559_t:CDS:2, partial [Racocetra fulgida]
AGVDYTPVDKCATSDVGKNLFVKSVSITESYGVTKSCTIYIDGKLRCIKDGFWYNCLGGHEFLDIKCTTLVLTKVGVALIGLYL